MDKAWPALLLLSLVGISAGNVCATPPESSPAAPLVASHQPAIGTGLFRGRVVQFEIVDGWAVVEGDIVLGRAEELEHALAKIESAAPAEKSLSVDDTDNLWPKGAGGVFEIPYTIEADPNSVVPGVVQMFNTTFAGFIQFIPRTTQANYVAFALGLPGSATSCNSSVGRVGGKQNINGPRTCSAAILLHEMGHAIGLLHEQSRADRDQYVAYQSQNSTISPAPYAAFTEIPPLDWIRTSIPAPWTSATPSSGSFRTRGYSKARTYSSPSCPIARPARVRTARYRSIGSSTSAPMPTIATRRTSRSALR